MERVPQSGGGRAAGSSAEPDGWRAVLRGVRRPHFILVALLLLAFLATNWSVRNITALRNVDEWTRDFRISSYLPPEPQNEEIVIVGVDEETLAQFPYRTPLDRAFLARLVTKFDQAGARAIMIDLLLDTATEPEKDLALRKAIAEAKTIVMPIWASDDVDQLVGTNDDTEGSLARRQEITKQRQDKVRWFLQGRPTGYGMLKSFETNGTVRWHHPLFSDEWPRYQISAALAKELGYDIPEVKRQRIDWHGQPVSDRFASPFAIYPAMSAQYLPDEWWKDKIVLIGPILADDDLHRTPFSTSNRFDTVAEQTQPRPGVVIHAHILSQIIEGRTLASIGRPAEIAITLMLCTLGIVMAVVSIPFWAKSVVAVGVSGAIITGGLAIYATGGPMLPIVEFLLGFVLSSVMATVYLSRRNKTQRAMIRAAFTKYVPTSVVDRLELDPSRLKLGGERRHITLIFTDLQGFTAMSERLDDAELLGDIINDYLEGLGDKVLEFGGTIDKFLGDGSMSFFGAPADPQADDAERAVQCALQITEFSRRFTEKWNGREAPNGTVIRVGRTRIGIHTGSAVVGNFGGTNRFDYTALGDAVNTGARLEAANKFLGTDVLASETTVSETPNLTYRPVGDVVLSGKQQAIKCYEPLAQNDPRRAYLDGYMEAYRAMAEGRQAALENFAALAEAHPEDRLVRHHAERLANGETGERITLSGK